MAQRERAFQASFCTVFVHSLHDGSAARMPTRAISSTTSVRSRRCAPCIERGERGAFARAASELAVDVSVLRRRMQTLATFVGAPLVEGRGNRLRLTPAGSRARAHAVRTLEAAAELAVIGEDDVGPAAGRVHRDDPRGAPPAGVARAPGRAIPRLLFRVRRAGAEASRALLAEDEVDFAVVRGAERPAGVASVRLAADRLWLAVRPREPARDARGAWRWRPSRASRSSATRRRPRR